MSKMLHLMKKELSTGVCKSFIVFIIDIKRKKMSVFWKKKKNLWRKATLFERQDIQVFVFLAIPPFSKFVMS